MKIKATWIISILCIIFMLSTFNLAAQKGALKAKYDKQLVDIDNLLTTNYDLKQQLEAANTKLAQQESTLPSLQKSLDEANAMIQSLNAEKETLLGEARKLKDEKLTAPAPMAPKAPEAQQAQ